MSAEIDKTDDQQRQTAASERKRLRLQRLRLKYAKEIGAVRFKALPATAQSIISTLADVDFRLELLRQQSIAGVDAAIDPTDQFVRLANTKKRLLKDLERLKAATAPVKPKGSALAAYIAQKVAERDTEGQAA